MQIDPVFREEQLLKERASLNRYRDKQKAKRLEEKKLKLKEKELKLKELKEKKEAEKKLKERKENITYLPEVDTEAMEIEAQEKAVMKIASRQKHALYEKVKCVVLPKDGTRRMIDRVPAGGNPPGTYDYQRILEQLDVHFRTKNRMRVSDLKYTYEDDRDHAYITLTYRYEKDTWQKFFDLKGQSEESEEGPNEE